MSERRASWRHLPVATLLSLSVALSTPAQVEAQPSAFDRRETIVTVVSWYGPLGARNGSRTWKEGGYGYAKARQGGGNYPLTAEGVPVHAAPPEIGSVRELREQEAVVRKDVAAIKRAGFTVIAYDMLPDPRYKASRPVSAANAPFSGFELFQLWLKIAQEEGIKLALFADVMNRSSDFPEGRKLTSDEWVACLVGALRAVRDAPALFRQDGRPVLFHFGTDSSSNAPPSPKTGGVDGGWGEVMDRVRGEGINVYFVPDVRPSSRLRDWEAVGDAIEIFAPGAPTSFLVDYQKKMVNLLSRPVVWTVSPGYYSPRIQAYVAPSFERLHRVYTAAIESNASAINVLTWNDFEESTDIAPSSYKGNALLDVVAFYNAWFLTGKQPAIDSERVVLAYPIVIPDSVRSVSPKWGKWREDDFSLRAFYWIASKSSGSVVVNGTQVGSYVPGVTSGSTDLKVNEANELSATSVGTIVLPRVRRSGATEDGRPGNGLHHRYLTIPSKANP